MNLRLLQLASPSLPVGAYSYSQGLEAAIDAGLVVDAPSAQRWIGDVLALTVGAFEAPVFARLVAAFATGDVESARHWNAFFVAGRETAELRAETLQMGYSLRRLLHDLQVDTAPLEGFDELAWPTAFASAVATWRIDPREALAAYLFAWIENQVLAAVKTVPLGQTDGQRLLLALGDAVPAVVERALACSD